MPGSCHGLLPTLLPAPGAHSPRPAKPGLISLSGCLWVPTLGQVQAMGLLSSAARGRLSVELGGSDEDFIAVFT